MSKIEQFFSYTSILLVIYAVSAWFAVDVFYDGYAAGFAAVVYLGPAIILSLVYGTLSILTLILKRHKEQTVEPLLKIALSLNLLVLFLLCLRLVYLDMRTW